MKDRKIFKAIRTQLHRSDGKEYVGLRLATLAIIQAKGLLYAEAREVTDYVGFYMSVKELAKWIRI